MKLPSSVRSGVERALAAHGLGRRLTSVTPVGGGCINNGARVETDAHLAVFLKWNRSAPAGMFEAEADGLEALARAAPLRVPAPLAFGEEDDAAWLLMEHVAPGSPERGSLRALGTGLAEMHAHPVGGSFGWERDNWIGSLEQSNEPSSSWGAFWRDLRIRPQLSAARARGRARDAVFDDVLAVTPGALADVETPELLHGDLWGGNWFASEAGEPVLVDPAVYRGHGEVDLAMSELFGGFGPAFYDAYADAHGITAAYEAYRRDLYQLYYLLVHVNLFGGAYEAGSRRSAESIVSELR